MFAADASHPLAEGTKSAELSENLSLVPTRTMTSSTGSNAAANDRIRHTL
ncbi:MAG: hypothetical protein QM688_01905 [Sphingomonas bacterium]